MPDSSLKKERLRAAIKTNDGWWASIFAGPMANRWLERIADDPNVSPNSLTIFSLLVGFLAAMSFAIGNVIFLFIGGILVQVSFIVDCMDGQLARYRQEFSPIGAWLDRISDRVKDFLYFIGLAFGYFHLHREGDYYAWLVWPIAMTAFFAVFLIDYYVNQNVKLEPLEERLQDRSHRIGKQDAAKKAKITLSSLIKNAFKGFLQLGLMVYKYIPILRFNIGEQALLITLFCFFNAVMPLLIFFAGLGTFYLFYWPVAKLYGYTEKKKTSVKKTDYDI